MSWRIKPDKAALVVVDAQDEFWKSFPGIENLEKKLSRLIQGAAALDVPVYFTELTSGGGVVSSLKKLAPEGEIFSRAEFSAGGVLKKIDRPDIILAGVEAHAAVRQTAYDLRISGKIPHLVVDAIGARDELCKDVAFGEMSADRFLMTTTEACLFELLGSLENPRFEEIVKLLAG